MKRIALLLFPMWLFATDAYFSYIEKMDRPTGSWEKGEIEVVLDPVEISKIVEFHKSRLLKKGFSASDAEDFSRIGIIAEDFYWIWLRDAVYFPNHIPGVYDRLIWKCGFESGTPGVAVLPVLPDGRIVLNLNYRHATRSWELELPRGAKSEQESDEEAARRELREETGMEVGEIQFLGNMAPDSGTISSIVPIFMGSIASHGKTDQEYSEAIAEVIAFTRTELNEGLLQGFLEIALHGEKKKIPLRDPFLSFALLQVDLRK